MRRLAGLVIAATVFAAGCGGAVYKKSEATRESAVKDARRAERDDGRQAAGGEAPPKAKAEKAPERKVIYTGRTDLVVEDFDKAEAGLLLLLDDHKGRIARSERRGRPGDPRTGSWTLRIPAADFKGFLKELDRLGEVRHSSIDSEDVTDRYYDVKAEVATLEAREKALRALLQDKSRVGSLKDHLDMDRELTSVRGQINLRMGQIQRWDNETAYSTLHLTIQDRRGYVPTTAPDFGTSVGRTWHASIDALVTAGKGIVLAAVAVTPWLAPLVVVVALLLLVRWLLRRPPPAPEAVLEVQPADGPPAPPPE